MVNLISACRATLLVWTSIFHSVQPTTVKGQISDMSLVSGLINYVKPYIQTLQLGPQTVYERSILAASPQVAIDEKIKELKPFLQDDDTGEELELEGDEETTIIEFTPRSHNVTTNDTKNNTDSFENNLRKYKKMRNKIKLALERESVTNKTKQVVIRTLDELIATLVQKQCPQNLFQNSEYDKIFKRANFFFNVEKLKQSESNKVKNNIVFGKPISIAEYKEIAQKIRNIKNKVGATEFRSTFKALLKKLLPANTRISKLYDSFTRTFSDVLRDTSEIPDKYIVRCSLVDVDKERMRKNLRNRDVCRDFRVCSEELKEFLTVFYKSLNDTAVRTLRNYAAMYERDIIADESEEKHGVVNVINHVSDIVEERVANVFIKTTAQIKLDENKDRDMNIAALRDYVKHTIKTVNKTIAKHIESDLSSLKARLLLPIKDDIVHNLDSDLGHFETDVIKQICSFFVTCKGNLFKINTEPSRKQFTVPGKKSNTVFVKLQLAMDDEFRDKLVENHKAMVQELRAKTVSNNDTNKTGLALRSYPEFNVSNIVVTRTTLYVDVESLPTTKVNKFLSEEHYNSKENI